MMKASLLAIAALGLALPLASAAPKAARQTSAIYAFSGPHNGTMIFSGYNGTTTGSFKASKKKEVGTLTLQSNVDFGGDPLIYNETISFQKDSVTWTLLEIFADGTTITASGTGAASIQGNLITYVVAVNFSGTPTILSGTMILGKNHQLTIQETTSFGGTSSASLYQLNGKRPKR